jgi:hypothetical protein
MIVVPSSCDDTRWIPSKLSDTFGLIYRNVAYPVTQRGVRQMRIIVVHQVDVIMLPRLSTTVTDATLLAAMTRSAFHQRNCRFAQQ